MISVLLEAKKFTGGPNVFKNRLMSAMADHKDVNVISKPKKKHWDIELGFIKFGRKHSKPKVLRLDGCYYRNEQLGSNGPIRSAIQEADEVIFQSNFSRAMCKQILKIIPRRDTVIYNGIDFNWIASIDADKRIEPGSFCASANWRENKRPASMIEGFLEHDLDRKLYIIGGYNSIPGKFRKDKRIVCLGSKTTEESIAIMKSCQYQMHLCHIDSCPNSVVEGLACGLNVLCTNLGGTPELVKRDGVILDVDRWNFVPQPFERLDSLNPKTVASGIEQLLKIKRRSNRPDLKMKNCSNQYVKVLQRNVRKR